MLVLYPEVITKGPNRTSISPRKASGGNVIDGSSQPDLIKERTYCGGVIESLIGQQIVDGNIIPFNINPALSYIPIDLKSLVFNSLSITASQGITTLNSVIPSTSNSRWKKEVKIGISPRNRSAWPTLVSLVEQGKLTEEDIMSFSDGKISEEIVKKTGLMIANPRQYADILRSSSPKVKRIIRDEELAEALASLANAVVLRLEGDYHIAHFSGALDLLKINVINEKYLDCVNNLPKVIYADRGYYSREKLDLLHQLVRGIKRREIEIKIIEIKALTIGNLQSSAEELLKRNHRYDPIHYTLTLIHTFRKLFPKEFADGRFAVDLLESLKYYLLKLYVHPLNAYRSQDYINPVPLPEIITINSFTQQEIVDYMTQRVTGRKKKK